MAALEKAIAELSTKYGGAPNGGGDSMELPHIGGPNAPGVGMPGGTIGTNSMGIAHGPGAPGGTVGTHETTSFGRPKSGLAGGTIGTEKSLGGHNPLHRHQKPLPGTLSGDNPLHRHHRHLPGVSVAKSASPGATVGTKTPVYSVAKSASPGATIGTKTPVLQTAQVAAAVPAPAVDPELAKVLGSVPGGGGGGGLVGQGTVNSSSFALSNMGGGGAAGGVIGT